MDRLRSFGDVIGKGAGAALGALDNTRFGRWLNRESLGSNEANRESAAYNKLIAPHTPGQETAAKVGHFAGAAVPSLAAGALTGGLADVPEAIGGGSQLLRLGAKAALEAAAQGGASKLAGGKFSTGAEAGAALPAVGAALRPAGRFLQTKAPGYAIQTALRMPLRSFRNIAANGEMMNPPQAIAEEGIIAHNLEGMGKKVGARVSAYRQQAQDALANPAIQRRPTNAIPLIVRPFREAAAQAMKAGNEADANALINRANALIRAHGGRTELELALPRELQGVKESLQGAANYGESPLTRTPATTRALRQAGSNVRKAIEHVAPEAGAANAKAAPLIAANKGIRDAIARRTSRGFNLTSPDFAALIGSGLIGGFAPARSPLERAEHIGEFIAGERMLTSPLGATLVAQGLRRAPQIAGGAGQLARAGYIAAKAKR